MDVKQNTTLENQALWIQSKISILIEHSQQFGSSLEGSDHTGQPIGLERKIWQRFLKSRWYLLVLEEKRIIFKIWVARLLF